jgi:A/G-specific adenine glycosylase
MDGNIRRVLSRVFNVTAQADSAAGERQLRELAEAHLPTGRAGEYNQALMDLGATICVPSNPRCRVCPLNTICEARRLGVQDERPVLKVKASVPQRVFAAAVVIRRGRVLLAQRPSRGLLGGMWEFPNVRVYHAEPLVATRTLRKQLGLGITCSELLGVVQHGYSHFTAEVHAFRCTMNAAPSPKGLQWIRLRELDALPMGRIDRQIARMLE